MAQPFKRMSAEGPGQPHKRPALADLTAVNQRRFSGGGAAAPGSQSAPAPRVPLAQQRTNFTGFSGGGGSPQPMVVSPPPSPKQPPQQVGSSAGTAACQPRVHECAVGASLDKTAFIGHLILHQICSGSWRIQPVLVAELFKLLISISNIKIYLKIIRLEPNHNAALKSDWVTSPSQFSVDRELRSASHHKACPRSDARAHDQLERGHGSRVKPSGSAWGGRRQSRRGRRGDCCGRRWRPSCRLKAPPPGGTSPSSTAAAMEGLACKPCCRWL